MYYLTITAKKKWKKVNKLNVLVAYEESQRVCIELNSTETYYLVTDGIIEMTCVADSYQEAVNLFIEYLKNQNDDCIYEFKNSGEIYEYKGRNLNTVHFIFNKHYIDFLRSRK